MTSVRDSSIDEAALRAAAQQWQGLADALDEVAGEVAGQARAHVAAAHRKYAGRGLPYRVRTRSGTGPDGMPRATITAPLGAFLGTRTGLRLQSRAWGHVTELYHVADDYVLRDAADIFEAHPAGPF